MIEKAASIVNKLPYEPPDPNDREWQKFLASRVEEKHLAAKERNGGRPVKPPFGVTVIIGEMGCGKNLVATEFCARNYMRGVEVYSTSSAGMRFGKKLDISRGAKDIYAFGKSIKAAILLIDELQLYFNKMRQSNTSAVYFVESLAGLRKQGIHVLITAQDDNQLAGSVKRAVTTALFPQPMAYLPRVSRFGKRLAPTRRRGRRKWALLKVETLEGRRALWFGDPPNALQMVRGRQPPMPVTRTYYPDYKKIVLSAALYGTHAELEVGAHDLVDSKELKQAIR